jgi:transposase-like protein
MTESPDLDRRVTRLEQEMIELRQDTSLANTLAREAGLEVSVVHANYRAHTHTLNALRETQAEHSRILGEHSQMHRGHTRTLNTLRETQAEHSRILHEHTGLHQEHSRILGEHTELHRDHSRVLGEHSQMHRAHTQTLNALRETQAEHSRMHREHTERFDRLEQKVDHGFSIMSVGMAQITALLTNKLNEGEAEE